MTNDSKQAVCNVGEPGCTETHPDACCPRSKPVMNQQGEPYCARCWSSLGADGLPIKAKA